MSRIGKSPITLPQGVSFRVEEDVLIISGPKGELRQKIDPEFMLEENEGVFLINRPSESKDHRSKHGLYRSLINNMVIGVSEGYKKELELVGVGYRASNVDQVLELSLGYSHPIYLVLPSEITIETKSERNQNPKIFLESFDKQLLGQVCAKIRSLRKVEPYKGKGVRFVGEQIRRKAGKSAKV